MESTMTALFATDTTRPARRQVSLARGRDVISNFLHAWRNRREFYRLGDMTDAELKDIGLTRADLYFANALPYGRDPTARLRAIVEARTDAA
jgi:uncharacterized protein YjiS (DUF1127 family)